MEWDIPLNKKTASGDTLRKLLPGEIENEVIEILNKHSIVNIKNNYSIAQVSSYRICIVNLYFKLHIKLIKEEKRTEMLMNLTDLETTKIDWFLVDWNKK